MHDLLPSIYDIATFIHDIIVLARSKLTEQLVGGARLVDVGTDACHHMSYVGVTFVLNGLLAGHDAINADDLCTVVVHDGVVIILLHHLLTVQADFPTCSANHLLVFSCSARTAFMRFNLAVIFYKDKVLCKDNIIL